jgi:membrane-associated phospholipid phosphatase
VSPRPSSAPRRGVLLALLAVTGSLGAVRSGRVERLDQHVGRVLATPRGPAVDRLVGATTDLGSVYGLTGTAGVLAVAGHRRRAVELLAAGLTAWTVAQAAKPLANRPRPYQAALAERLVAEPAGSSWPSGHTAVVAAMGASLAPGMPRPARWAVGVVAVGVGCSRLYVGVHHPSDLVAGAGIGLLCARGARTLRMRVGPGRGRRSEETSRGRGAGSPRCP